jgi:NADH:ubiquinone oxidoreductase subunit E
MSDTPATRTRIVLCMGEYCNLGRRAEKLYRLIEPQVSAINAGYALNERPLKLETARCLSMCAIGPNCVIYPQDEVFNKLDEAGVADLLALVMDA